MDSRKFFIIMYPSHAWFPALKITIGYKLNKLLSGPERAGLGTINKDSKQLLSITHGVIKGTIGPRVRVNPVFRALMILRPVPNPSKILTESTHDPRARAEFRKFSNFRPKHLIELR